MKTEQDIERMRLEFASEHDEALAEYYSQCFEACIPKSFWLIKAEEITHNREVFKRVILKYCSRRRVAQKRGYSLLLIGDNGVGKTTFISFVLTQMIRRGCTAYYTTLSDLDTDIKRGFSSLEHSLRLDSYLDSDFLSIDEVGKEHFKTDSYLMTRLEALMKKRYDNGDPTLLASNLDMEQLNKMYGASVASMLDGRYIKAFLETGDFRRTARGRMELDMGLRK